MDAAGTGECIKWLRAIAPDDFENAQLTEDGDAKTRMWDINGWTISKCKCHKGKNIPVCLNRKMSGIACTCRTGGKSCVNYDGYRYKDIIGRRAAARYYKIIHDAEMQYIPELHSNGILAPDCLVGTPEREERRHRAIEWAKREVFHMALHFRGEHHKCGHGDLPANHPAVRCNAQRRYLAEVLHSLVECIGDVLTPFGAIDINSTESLHAVLRRYRPKGEKWGAVQCFLGETMGFLHWQRLHLGFWQPGCRRNPMFELAKLIEAELNISVPLDKRDVEDMEQRLQAAVEAKEARLHPSWKTRRAQRKAERLGYAAQSAASSTYQGGQLAAGRSAVGQLEIDFYGMEDGGVGLDPTETKGEQHASDMSPAGPQPGDFEVEVEGDYAGGGSVA